MSSNSTPGHPVLSHQEGGIDLWPPGDADLTSINPEVEDILTMMNVSNNGGDETIDQPEVGHVNLSQLQMEEEDADGIPTFLLEEDAIETILGDSEFSISNIDHNGVITEEECDLPPPPGQGQCQPRRELQATIKLPSVDVCLNEAQPDLTLLMQFGEDEVHFWKIDLHQFLGSLSNSPSYETSSSEVSSSISPPPLTTTPFANSTRAGEQDEDQVANIDLQNFLESFQCEESLPQSPPEEAPSLEGTSGTEEDISISPCSSSPGPSSHNRNVEQVPIFSPSRNLGPWARRSIPSQKKGVNRPQVKVNPSAGGHHPSPQDERAGWPYPCPVCSKRFPIPSKLKAHIFVHTGEKPLTCEECGKCFNQKSHLNRHLRLHNPATRHAFSCQECGRGFSEKGHLTRHINFIHLEHKDIPCPQCDRKFGTKSNMMTHFHNVHLQVRHPCRKPNCEKTFASKSALRKHQNSAHRTTD